MTKFSEAELFGMTIRESANDGSDFTNPSADYRRLFLGEDGLLHLRDSSGTITTPGGVSAGAITSSGLTMATARLLGRTTASSGAIEEISVGSGLSLSAGSLTATGGSGITPTKTIVRYTGGDITVNSTSAGADLSGIGDATIAASTGDLLLIGASVRTEGSPGGSLRCDAKFITGSTENYVSSLTTTPAGQGVSGWFFGVSVGNGWPGVPYVVQAADITGGNVVISPRGWVASSSHVLAADSDAPFVFWVINFKQ